MFSSKRLKTYATIKIIYLYSIYVSYKEDTGTSSAKELAGLYTTYPRP